MNRLRMAAAALSCLFAMVAAPVVTSQAADIDSSAEFAFVTDFASGKVLMEKDPDALMKPASMAKIMTVYIAFQRIADGSLSLDDTFLISEKAWRKGAPKPLLKLASRCRSRSSLWHCRAVWKRCCDRHC